MKKYIKKIISASSLTKLKAIENKFQKCLLYFVHKNKFISNFYYVFSMEFANEHYSVLSGRKAYFESLEIIGTSCALLRRNIHRLEKGLIMRPRRIVFAEDYIQETVEFYRKAISSSRLNAAEKKWAADVLFNYFEVIGHTTITDLARKTYHSLLTEYAVIASAGQDSANDGKKFTPYKHSELPGSSISIDKLEELYYRRRSVRWYKNRDVPRELVQYAANIASFAPSACNRQSYMFYFCNEKKRTVAIANCVGGTAGFADNLPSIVIVVGNLSGYPLERDRHLIYIDAAMATMQLMLALETLGLSTCAINWPDVNENEVNLRKLIKLEDFEQVIMLVAVGYADSQGGIPYSQKKQNQEIFKDISL
jgi:nitroreductase